jgi:hypothetical protein
MTTVAAVNRKPKPGQQALMNDSAKARMFLAMACFWPIFVLALFAASAPQLRANPRALIDKNSKINQELRLQFRTALDRVDIMGYGPTHPRMAVVIVGDESDKIISSVESLFRYVWWMDTRVLLASGLFCVCVCVCVCVYVAR